MPTCPGARLQVGRTLAVHHSARAAGPCRGDLGAAQRAQWPGVSNSCTPNTEHTRKRKRGAEAEQRWGGRLPAEGTIASRAHPTPRQNWQGAARAAGATQRPRWRGAEGEGWASSELKSSAFSLGAGSRGNGGRAVGRRTTGLALHFPGRWKAGCWEWTRWARGLVRNL